MCMPLHFIIQAILQFLMYTSVSLSVLFKWRFNEKRNVCNHFQPILNAFYRKKIVCTLFQYHHFRWDSSPYSMFMLSSAFTTQKNSILEIKMPLIGLISLEM